VSKLNQVLFPSNHHKPAVLVLSDGTIYHGVSVGVDGSAVAEVVFNTAITGYQEILSDPSYAEQMVTLTYPHIGNTGTTVVDDESRQVFAKGLIIRDYPVLESNWRSEASLQAYLEHHQVVAISDIDTRALTNKLREQGSLAGCIMAGDIDLDQALQTAQNYPGLEGMDLAKEVSCAEQHEWNAGCYDLMAQQFNPATGHTYRVVCYDFGIKRNILRILSDLGCQLTVVPAQTPAEEVLAMAPDGVFLSNGPGDPAAFCSAITAFSAFFQACHCLASAWVIRSWPWRWARRP
jgi:carbamoyl-phosphate synthase small subunit